VRRARSSLKNKKGSPRETANEAGEWDLFAQHLRVGKLLEAFTTPKLMGPAKAGGKKAGCNDPRDSKGGQKKAFDGQIRSK